MGVKLLWTGLTLVVAFQAWNPGGIPEANIVGSVLMIIGLIRIWLDK